MDRPGWLEGYARVARGDRPGWLDGQARVARGDRQMWCPNVRNVS